MTVHTAAQWVSAVGSAGSLLGFASYVWIMLLNRKDEAEVRQEQQALGVSAWLDEGRRFDREEQFVICVHNHGVAPVFSVRALFSLPSSRAQHSVGLAIVPPSTTATRALPFREDQVDSEELYSAPAVPELRFTDSLGTQWQRAAGGQLTQLNKQGPRRRPQFRRKQQDRQDAEWERQHREESGDVTTHRQ